MPKTVTATDATFKTEVLASPLPVIVDFTAPHCGPCVALAPVLEKLAQEHDGKLKVVKIDVDDNPETAADYGIRSLPAIVLFKRGARVDALLGNVPRAKLDALVAKALSPAITG